MRVWQDAMETSIAVLVVAKGLPSEERYALTGQIRRSSCSVVANITEAWMKRHNKPAFLPNLNEAMTEAAETQTWLESICRCGYLTE
ncbi:MAG: four helix bundle protein [Armatimonadia bacterium]